MLDLEKWLPRSGPRNRVGVFYGEEGPGRLYQRDYMLDKLEPTLVPLHMDTSPIDYWWLK